MKVLFLNAYFDPEIAASLYLYANLAEDLVKSGHEVAIVCPTPTRGVTPEVRELYSRKRRLESSHDGRLQIRRIAIPKEGTSSIARAIRYIWLEIRFFIVGLMADFDVAFLYSTPPTQGPLAGLLCRFKKKPVLYNIQDLFPDSMVSTGLTRTHTTSWHIGVLLQRFTYRSVSRVVTISENLAQGIIEGGMDPRRIDIVQNWVDCDEVSPVSRADNCLWNKFDLDPAKFYITYCGNLGQSQNLELLSRVAQDLQDHSDISFVVIGDGVAKEKLQRSTINLSNFHIFPFQPYQLISDVFSLGDVGLIISKPHVGFNSVPSKAWSIMAAGRPILASFDLHSELVSKIHAADCGITCPPDDQQRLIDAIFLLYRDSHLRRVKGENGRRYANDNLSRQASTRNLISILESLVGNPKS